MPKEVGIWIRDSKIISIALIFIIQSLHYLFINIKKKRKEVLKNDQNEYRPPIGKDEIVGASERKDKGVKYLLVIQFGSFINSNLCLSINLKLMLQAISLYIFLCLFLIIILLFSRENVFFLL